MATTIWGHFVEGEGVNGVKVERNLLLILVPGSVRVWRGGEGKTEEPVLVTGWHLAPELVPQVKSYLFLDKHFIME